MSPNDVMSDNLKSFINDSPLSSIYPNVHNPRIIPQEDIFRKSKLITTPTRPATSGGRLMLLNSLQFDQREQLKEPIRQSTIKIPTAEEIRKVSDNSDALSLKRSRTHSTVTSPSVNGDCKPELEHKDFIHFNDNNSENGNNNNNNNDDDGDEGKLKEINEWKEKYTIMEQKYLQEVENVKSLQLQVERLNLKVELFEEYKANMKLKVDSLQESKEEMKYTLETYKALVHEKDSKPQEIREIREEVVVPAVVEETPKKSDIAIQTETETDPVVQPTPLHRVAIATNKETQTDTITKDQTTQTDSNTVNETTQNSPDQIQESATTKSTCTCTKKPTKITKPTWRTDTKEDLQTIRDHTTAAIINRFPEFSFSLFDPEVIKYYKLLHLEEVDKLSQEDLKYLAKKTMCHFMISFNELDKSLKRFAKFIYLTFQFINNLHVIIYPGQKLKCSDYYRGRVFRNGVIDEEMIGLEECLDHMLSNIKQNVKRAR